MQSVHQMIGQTQDSRPIQPDNQVVRVVRDATGNMTCTQQSGNVFTIPASEEEMQAFVVFTMAHSNEL